MHLHNVSLPPINVRNNTEHFLSLSAVCIFILFTLYLTVLKIIDFFFKKMFSLDNDTLM